MSKPKTQLAIRDSEPSVAAMLESAIQQFHVMFNFGMAQIARIESNPLNEFK